MNEPPRRPIEEGQHYEHRRGQIYTVEHKNSDIVLLFDGTHYRLERLNYFRSELESGLYELRPDMEICTSEEEIPFEEIDWVGEGSIESLTKAGLHTPKDFEYRTDEFVLELDSVGEKALGNIRDWIKENDEGIEVKI